MKLFSKLSGIWKKLISRKRSKVIYRPPFVYDHTFKILLIGLEGVGKRNLTQRYCYDLFDPNDKLTVGVEFYVKPLEIHGKKIKLQIWDVAGGERFRFLLSSYVLGANAAMIIYDITKFTTLDQLNYWIQIIREKAGDIPIMLIGNKLDLEDSRELKKEKGIEIAEEYNLSGYSEISTKTGQNVEKAFEALTEFVMSNYM
ncbi:MAG: GTP-binding protein [Promethearchaeota archaeon]|jgi:small GTP-binding protein